MRHVSRQSHSASSYLTGDSQLYVLVGLQPNKAQTDQDVPAVAEQLREAGGAQTGSRGDNQA